MIVKCQICDRNILSHSRVMICKNCKQSAHIVCYGIMKDDVVEHNEWLCKVCLSEALPFYFYDDDGFQNALNSFIYDNDLDIASLKNLNSTHLNGILNARCLSLILIQTYSILPSLIFPIKVHVNIS